MDSGDPGKSSRLGPIAPHFIVVDVVKAAEHYRDILGFKIDGYFGEPPVFAMVVRDNVQIHFNKGDTSANRPNTGVAHDAYIHAPDVDALEAEFQSSGAIIVEGPVTRIYQQRELVVQDCNGFQLCFGQDVTSAGK